MFLFSIFIIDAVVIAENFELLHEQDNKKLIPHTVPEFF